MAEEPTRTPADDGAPESDAGGQERLTPEQQYQRLLDGYQAGLLSAEELARRRAELDVEAVWRRQREENVAVFYRYVELQNRRDYDALEQLFHEEYINHTYFGPHPISPKAHIRSLRGHFGAIPDGHLAVNEIIAVEGEWVIGRTTARGTQAATLLGRPGTGRQTAVPLIHCIRVVDGRIKEYRSTNPFQVPFQEDIIAPEDVQHARALQGVETAQSERWERLLDEANRARLVDDAELAQLRDQVAARQSQCQALLEENWRRCYKQARPGSLYCEYHEEHGYGRE